jgi:alpha-D-glucose phosphate-specific phosphoglucomutase
LDITFGTDGWRARMDDSFNEHNVRIVAQAIAGYIIDRGLAERGLVIGYDTRLNSKEFAVICSEVMSGNDIPVYLADRAMPTPITAFAITLFEAAGAIMITASHNPGAYNGIKFIPEYAGPASPEITGQIVNNIKELAPADILSDRANSRMNHFNPISDYISYLKKIVNFDVFAKKPIKVVIDPMYGAAYEIVDLIFQDAGCDVISVHNYPDPSFGGSLPDPSQENLGELAKLIRDKRADIGVALDGDADRFGAIDSEGVYIRANQILALLSDYLIRDRGLSGILVRSIATSHLLDAIAEKNDIALRETPKVGFKYIAEVVREEKVILGGEESGGLCVQGSIPEKDGILADLLLAELTAKKGQPLSTQLQEVHRQYGDYYDKRLDIEIASEKKVALLHLLSKNPPDSIGGKKLEHIDDNDGIRYTLAGGDWILARPSGTEPLVRIYIESGSKTGFSQLESFAQEIVGQV